MAHKLEKKWTSKIFTNDQPDPVDDGEIDIQDIEEATGVVKACKRKKGGSTFDMEGSTDPDGVHNPKVKELKHKDPKLQTYEGRLITLGGKEMIVGLVTFPIGFVLGGRTLTTQEQGTWVATNP